MPAESVIGYSAVMKRKSDHRPSWRSLLRPAGWTTMALAALLAFHDLGAAAPAPDRAHPFLFITTADVERARQGIQRGGVFAGLAKELAARAETNRIEDLPPLETAWWQAAKLKPWK